jgi:fatty-acyl-CoA synthase
VISADLLGERARLTPDKTALVYVPTGERLTYGDLNRRAERCAMVWQESLGLRKGDRVAILSHNRVEYAEAFFAAGKSGVVLVTLGTRLTAAELEHVIRDSGARIVVYESGFSETADLLRTEVGVETWIDLDDDWPRMSANLDPKEYLPEPCDAEDTYCLLYTSGTTGRPKGVMVPHRMVAWNAYNTVACWQLREDDVSPVFTPLYHAGGLMAFLTPLCAIGGTIVLHRGFDPAEIWKTIQQERCTVALGVPTIWKLLMDDPGFRKADLKHVRAFYSGGAPLPHYLIEAYQERGVVFKQGFGMTEVGVNCFSMTVEDSYRKIGSIGKPMMFTEVRLVDAEGNEVPVGEVGEMWFRGPHVSKGYWNDPEATAEALDDGGWFHSGDLARRDEEGFFYIAGRAKDVIISGGVNVYPAEIEARLLLHPDVEDAAVAGIPDGTWGEVGVAFVVPLQGRTLDPGNLSGFLQETLARFKIPKDFVFMDALPRTAYGKVVKGELRGVYLRKGSSR